MDNSDKFDDEKLQALFEALPQHTRTTLTRYIQRYGELAVYKKLALVYISQLVLAADKAEQEAAKKAKPDTSPLSDIDELPRFTRTYDRKDN